jgi:hypothetical protein
MKPTPTTAAVDGVAIDLKPLTKLAKTFTNAEATNGIVFPLKFPAGVLTQGRYYYVSVF